MLVFVVADVGWEVWLVVVVEEDLGEGWRCLLEMMPASESKRMEVWVCYGLLLVEE